MSMQLFQNKKYNDILIISHVKHYKFDNDIYAYSPYVKEIEIWADIFQNVTIACPLYNSVPPSDSQKFSKKNIDISPQIHREGKNPKEKFISLFFLPSMAYKLMKAMKKAETIHVRCPGYLGLLGIIFSPMFAKFRFAKYAGQWTNYQGESIFYRLQKEILKSKWWDAPVTVFGSWPNQPNHVIPFNPGLLSDYEMGRAKNSAKSKNLHDPLRILFVGRLSKSKNVDIVIKAVKILINLGVNVDCKIIGSGDQQPFLVELSESLGISNNIDFIGGLNFNEVLEYYEWGDVLVLVSKTEGWGKVITEAMAFGLVCFGLNQGIVPQILGNNRGITIETADEEELAKSIQNLIRNKQDYFLISKIGSKFAQEFSLSNMRLSIEQILSSSWK